MHTYSLTVADEYSNFRLDVFLADALPDAPSRSFIKRIIESQQVLVNGKRVKAHHKVCAGDAVEVPVPEVAAIDVAPENIALDIFYQDDDIAVINKPIGMMVHPATGCYSGTLVNALLFHFKNLSDVNQPHRPGIVHRLDRATSGLIIVAKNNVAHARLSRQFEKHAVVKRYVALVEGLVEFDEGVIDAPLGRHPYHHKKRAVVFHGSKEAQTRYHVITRAHNRSLVALFPQTGRTHQLRVHMAHLGHPILGDDKYGTQKSFNRLALHAQSIEVTHPTTRQRIAFSSVIPAEFLRACEQPE